MEKKFYIRFWLLLLAALGLYFTCLAPRNSRYSPSENRNLAPFPQVNAQTVFSGQFGRDFEVYLLDAFPARADVIRGGNALHGAVSLATHRDYLRIADEAVDPLDQAVAQDDVQSLLQELTPPSQTEAAPVAEDPPILPKPPVTAEDFPQLCGIYAGNDAASVFSRDNVLAVTAVLNKFARLLPPGGKLMATVVPQSATASLALAGNAPLSSTWDDPVNGLGDSNVYAFDAAQILSQPLLQGEYVYFRTDMHWTPYGAYLVYREMATQAGKTPCNYSTDFTLTTEYPFRGTYYRDYPAAYGGVQADVLELLMPKTQLSWRRLDGGELPFLNMNANPSDRYTVYLGGPGPWAYAESQNGETENCLLLTDSYGLGFLPFLTANYRQVHYYDPRYFDASAGSVAQLLRTYDIRDIYVVVGDLHSFDSAFFLTYANGQLGTP